MNLIIVEDDSMTCDNLKLLLQGEASVQSVSAFSSAEAATAADCWSHADVLLTDIDLPGINGDQLIAWATLNHPHVTSVAYTIHENRDTVFSAIKSGACGYLLKSSSPRELIEAMEDVYGGGAPMTARIARKVISEFHQSRDVESTLTRRETHILKLIEQGNSYKEVAAEASISPHTVHTHVKNIYDKVQANGRDEVVRKARRLGWI